MKQWKDNPAISSSQLKKNVKKVLKNPWVYLTNNLNTQKIVTATPVIDPIKLDLNSEKKRGTPSLKTNEPVLTSNSSWGECTSKNEVKTKGVWTTKAKDSKWTGNYPFVMKELWPLTSTPNEPAIL